MQRLGPVASEGQGLLLVGLPKSPDGLPKTPPLQVHHSPVKATHVQDTNSSQFFICMKATGSKQRSLAYMPAMLLG